MSELHQHGPSSDTDGPASVWWLIGAFVVGGLLSAGLFAGLLAFAVALSGWM